MNHIQHNYTYIKKQILLACQQANRDPDNIRLLAVSKGHDVSAIRCLLDLKHLDFGENKLQEAIPKIESLSDAPIRWHFIGPIQSNKTKQIATYFSWVHSLDNMKVATLLNKHRPKSQGELNVCVQVNIDEEPQKSGISIENVADFLDLISNLENINVRGIMCIPKNGQSENSFQRMKSIFDAHQSKYNLDTLSMGMSQDFESAILYGGNLIRVGRAIFNSQ